MSTNRRTVLAAVAVLGAAQPASADVITDWNTKAVAFLVSRNVPPPPAERVVAMTQVAMFDAVNSIERKYGPISCSCRPPQLFRKRPLLRPPPERSSLA